MLKQKTELVFIIDQSGSMLGLENDTLGGYNRLLNEQKKLEGFCAVTTIFFNTTIMMIHDRTSLNEIAPLQRYQYRPSGGTALLDAIGYGIKKTEAMLSGTLASERPTNIMFVIITDGEENSSREYSYEKIRSIITKKEKEDWIFQFLGANIDTFSTANSLGINQQTAYSYVADNEGIKKMYNKVNDLVKESRIKK